MTAPFVLPIWSNNELNPANSTQPVQETRSQPHGHLFIRNITQPTITVFLPDPARATGAAALVCPGGAFHFVTFDNEGTRVAEWLNERGIAAIVLKYRVVATPADDAEFYNQMMASINQEPQVRTRNMSAITQQIAPLAIADAQQALRLVKQHATEWGIQPGRVGCIGFSAGGRVVVGTALNYDPDIRPAFVAPIYGALFEELKVPADAPPMFIAVAANDELAAGPCLRLYETWHAAGKLVELHIYAQGGHGFGMHRQGLPSDKWIDQFGDWLGATGLL